MVGLVIISHSRALAEALVRLVRQVAQSTLPVALAAGVGEGRHELGTDAIDIMEAIQSVFSDDGVLVLMDLGSAILSAETALDLLPPELSSKVRFCGAPLVEGAIAAAVQVGLGGNLDDVCREANAALNPKRQHLGYIPDENPAGPALAAVQDASAITLTLSNLHGLHARPAAKFVQTVAAFDAEVKVSNQTLGKGPVSARSLNALATLGAIENHQVVITASGPDANRALQALRALVESSFGEPTSDGAASSLLFEETATVKSHKRSGAGSSVGIPISEGIALAALFRYEPPLPPIPEDLTEYPQIEWQRLQKALELSGHEIARRANLLKRSIGAQEAAIFDAHLLILHDPDLLDAARARIFEVCENAALAWHTAIQAAAQNYRDLGDSYLQSRAMDVEDVGRQVLFCLSGKAAKTPFVFDEPVILLADDLTPTETSQLDMERVWGIITSGGGPTSHSAILSRALGIPAVAGAGTRLNQIPNGTPVGLDGASGEMWVNPSPEVASELLTRRAEWLAQQEALRISGQDAAVTKDGKCVEVFANLGSQADVATAIKNGADGCGLLRTEFLFLTRETAPNEEEQYLLLRQIYEAMGPDRPVTTRTLDVGGDKELPYIQMPKEANPFLGVRALRLSLAQPELFLPQLRAILRAAYGLPCRIMFPMVAEINEVRKAREFLERAHQSLVDEDLPHAWPVEVGIMVEIPSAALLSPELAHEVDFFSIGTNDLTQYTLAAERGNQALAYLADGLHPAVLQLIQLVIRAAHNAGKWVGLCGELGGDVEAVPVLVGLGIDELSLNSSGIPRVKSIIRSITKEASRQLAERCLVCTSSEEVRQLVRA